MTDNNPFIPPAVPVLYSFRRCPYAMRARLAIAIAGVEVELREIELRHKPEAMLALSPKGTVPVLQLENGSVIDESLDIMLWALHKNDPAQWLGSGVEMKDDMQLIHRNDRDFKPDLDRYKYADRYPEFSRFHYRQQGERFLAELEQRLQSNHHVTAPHFALADAAILPFVRQFAAVDAEWFESSPYPEVRQWLNRFLNSRLLAVSMKKYPPWRPGDPCLFFGGAGFS